MIRLMDIKAVYFLGAGGIGMSALVRYFLNEGKTVAGYDRTASQLTERLAEEGAQLHFEENTALIPDACKDPETTLVVYTPAIPDDHKELAMFRKEGFTIKKRAEVLGIITKGKLGICAAGTHGKTTTSSIITQILYMCNYDPTAVIGGRLPIINANGRAGSSEYMVCESCEFVDTLSGVFLYLLF